MITLSVYVNTGVADGIIVVSGENITDAFKKIPIAAANKGLSLLNDGGMVTYKVMVQPPKEDS